MLRTQIQISAEQMRKLRKYSRQKGMSMAEAIRRCIDATLDQDSSSDEERYARAEGLLGAFEDKDGVKDLAENHDRYLEESFE